MPLDERRHARRLHDHQQPLLDLFVQGPQRVLGALDLFRQAQLLVARPAREHQDAVRRDAVLLGLDGVDVEVVVHDLQLRRLAPQVLQVVVGLFGDLAARGEEPSHLDRLVQVADDPARDFARARGPEVGQVDLLVALGGDVRDREREDQRGGQPQAREHRVADAADLDARRARHLGVRQLDEGDRRGGGQPDRRPQRAEDGGQPGPAMLERLAAPQDGRQIRLNEVEDHGAQAPARKSPAASARPGRDRGPRRGPGRPGSPSPPTPATGPGWSRRRGCAGADHPLAEEDGQHAGAPERRPATARCSAAPSSPSAALHDARRGEQRDVRDHQVVDDVAQVDRARPGTAGSACRAAPARRTRR